MEQWNSRVVGKRGHDHEIIVPYPAYTRVGMPTRDDGIIERIVVGKGIFPVKIVIAYVFEVIEFCYRTSLLLLRLTCTARWREKSMIFFLGISF